MNSVKITTDSSQIDNILEQIGDDEYRRNVIMKGLEAGANVLKEATMENMRSSWSGSSHYSKQAKGPLYTGVVIKKDKAYSEVSVDILGGDWRIRFYESPIKPRYTKKGYYRGTVPAYHFFRNARNNSAEQVADAIANKVSEELNKLHKYI